jgi:hypothetical protein
MFQLTSSDSIGFPDCCVSCGRPVEAHSRLIVGPAPQSGGEVPMVQVPHCRRCARGTQVIFLAGCLPFGLGFVLVGGAAFLAAAFGASLLGLDEIGQPNNANSLIIGAGAGLIAGIVGAVAFEVLARGLLLIVFDRALWNAPLLAAQMFDDSDHVAGLTYHPARAGRPARLTFFNDAVAAEFAALNGLDHALL